VKNNSHLINKARKLRKKNKSIDDISKMLNKSRSTVYYWVRDIKLERPTEKQSIAQKTGTLAMVRKYKYLRENAYNEFADQAEELLDNTDLRDFILLYMCEGYRKNRNSVSICNSNTNMMRFVNNIIQKYSNNKISYRLQMHIDQDEVTLKNHWAKALDISYNDIIVARKSNSNQLTGRNWASRYGILTIRTSDTYFRSKIQALIDFINNSWA
jgi:hypothetical protein